MMPELCAYFELQYQECMNMLHVLKLADTPIEGMSTDNDTHACIPVSTDNGSHD